MSVYFNSYIYKDSDFGLNNGYIKNITLDGGTPPYVVNWAGPSGYSAGPFSGTPSTDLNNLAPGTYSGTVVDSLSSTYTTFVDIQQRPALSLSAGISDFSCLSGGCGCEVTVSGFSHNSDCFKYELKSGTTVIDTYTGCTGDEFHVFTGLCGTYLTLVATETTQTIYSFDFTSGCTTETIFFDETDDVDDLVNTWTRFALFGNHVITSATNGTKNTGLQPDGTISNAVGTYFERGVAWDRGDHYVVMSEGENIGPSGYTFSTGAPANDTEGDYYYNTYLGKYVVALGTVGEGFGVNWITFNPTEDTGQATGNPTATHYLTTSSNWSTPSLTCKQFTTSGNTNQVVLASDKMTVDTMIQASRNSAFINGFYSQCNFGDYIHEVTLGSTDQDDDEIGVVLAAFKDTEGFYGPTGVTHQLSLVFINRGTPSVQVTYNRGQSAYSFGDNITPTGGTYNQLILQSFTGSPFNYTTSVTNNYEDRGYARVKIVKSGNNIKIYTTETMGITGSLTRIFMGLSGGNGYTPGSYTNIPVTGSGIGGLVDFFVTPSGVVNAVNVICGGSGYTTTPVIDFDGVAGGTGATISSYRVQDPTVSLGDSNPYNPILFDFDLLDKNTWLDAPAYAVGDELEKFVDNARIGYLTGSQPRTQFLDISFSGNQTNFFVSEIPDTGASISEVLDSVPTGSTVPVSATCKSVITLCDSNFNILGLTTTTGTTNTLTAPVNENACTENGLSILELENYKKVFQSFWLQMVEQFIPATTIFVAGEKWCNAPDIICPEFDECDYDYEFVEGEVTSIVFETDGSDIPLPGGSPTTVPVPNEGNLTSRPTQSGPQYTTNDGPIIVDGPEGIFILPTEDSENGLTTTSRTEFPQGTDNLINERNKYIAGLSPIETQIVFE
jgi:hypothetical protein